MTARACAPGVQAQPLPGVLQYTCRGARLVAGGSKAQACFLLHLGFFCFWGLRFWVFRVAVKSVGGCWDRDLLIVCTANWSR